MKRSVATILMILVTCFTALAQRESGVEISVNSGLAIPVAPMTY
jgi:hypothetical protein